MSLNNRHQRVGKHNSTAPVYKYAAEVLKLEWDLTDWTELDTSPSSASAFVLTPMGGSSGAAPSLSVASLSGQKVLSTLSAGDAGHKTVASFNVTMADGQIKRVLTDIYVVADPSVATSVLSEAPGMIDGRYIIVGGSMGGAVIPSTVKKAAEAYEITFDFSAWNRESGTTVSSASAAVFTDAGVNAPTFSGVAASGQKVTGLLAAGNTSWSAGGYGLMSLNVTMANAEVKRIFLAIKVD